MKFLLFGTGDYYERYKKWFRREDVAALLDNSPKKQNTIIDEVKVLSPEEGIRLPFDVVVILSFYVKEMRSQLMKLGVSEDIIYHFYDLHKLIDINEFRKPIQYYGNAKELIESNLETEKKVLLLSQDMTLGGPAIALFHAAEVLVKNGYQVLYASMLDGPLRNKLQSAGIPVVVDVNLQIETMKDADWMKDFSLIFCNTINYHVFLSERDVGIPIVWWLHDSLFFYDGIDSSVLIGLDLTNLKVCSVGPVPKLAIRCFLPNLPVDSLLYGVADTAEHMDRMPKAGGRKVNFVTIGYIEARKGQDILVQAIKLLPDEIRGRAVFYLVGQDTSVMARQLKTEIESMPEVVMTGTVGRERIDELLGEADALICPSREDPMPTVAAEAMMHGVPCIVSDVTGTAAYIQDGTDGFIFSCEDVEELAAKIIWCVDHIAELPDMGRKSRKIYDDHFSMEIFEKDLMHMIE